MRFVLFSVLQLTLSVGAPGCWVKYVSRQNYSEKAQNENVRDQHWESALLVELFPAFGRAYLKLAHKIIHTENVYTTRSLNRDPEKLT